MYCCDVKLSLEIVLVDVQDLQDFAVCKMVFSCEAEFLTESQEKWNLVHKENIHGQEDLCMALQQFRGHFDKVPCH